MCSELNRIVVGGRGRFLKRDELPPQGFLFFLCRFFPAGCQELCAAAGLRQNRVEKLPKIKGVVLPKKYGAELGTGDPKGTT